MGQRGEAVFAADSGLLIAAERHFHRCKVVVVDPAGARLQLTYHAMRARQVQREHARRKTLWRIVGAGDSLVLVAERQHAHDRTEDFLARDAHAVLHIGEDSRFDEEAVFEAL